MFTRICSGEVCGIEGQLVSVESDISEGFPSYLLVGYLASEVKEARERVTSAMKNSGYHIPAKKIVINLSPAGMRKQGATYDLPIALSLLGALGMIPQERFAALFAAGELSLDGSLLPVKGILSLVLMAKKEGMRTCLVPVRNVTEARLILSGDGEGPRMIGVENLKEAVAWLNGDGIPRMPVQTQGMTRMQVEERDVDFADIIGQERLKRVITVAVAGMHHLLMIGPPGSGKSMSARAIRGILPPMTFEESLEVTRLYSVAGCLAQDGALMTRRPFRNPHHTVPVTTLTGGGRIPVPGEISLAHRGILFLDELAEFPPRTLEILRQPLEEGTITVNRLQAGCVFPADFMLVAAMNPCKCGYYPDRRRCRCSRADVFRYLHRVSRPLLNRIDICTEVSPPQKRYFLPRHGDKEARAGMNVQDKNLTSAAMAQMVGQARRIQQERFAGSKTWFNSRMTAKQVEEFCTGGASVCTYAQELFERHQMTMRGQIKLWKVARTIADLDSSAEIREEHLDEAASYREIERSYWESD